MGGLVTKPAAQPLTTIVPLDPIWVRFKVSEAAYLAFANRQNKDRDQAPSYGVPRLSPQNANKVPAHESGGPLNDRAWSRKSA